MNPNLAHKFYAQYIYEEPFDIQTPHSTTYHNEVMEIPIFNIFNVNEFHKFYLFKFSDKYDGLIGVDLLRQVHADVSLNKTLI